MEEYKPSEFFLSLHDPETEITIEIDLPAENIEAAREAAYKLDAMILGKTKIAYGKRRIIYQNELYEI